MKFKKMTEEAYGAKKAGYRFDRSVKWEQDAKLYARIKSERGENYAASLLDSFFDFDCDLYQGDDGSFYGVYEIMDLDDEFKPLYWWKLTKDGKPEEAPAAVGVEFSGGQSRTGDNAVNYMMAEVDGVELYAEDEIPGNLDENEITQFDDESYNRLKSEILNQAAANGIAADRLKFWWD